MADEKKATQPQKTAAEEAQEAAANDWVPGQPTAEDYERARTVGIGNEPELPPGKVETAADAFAEARLNERRSAERDADNRKS